MTPSEEDIIRSSKLEHLYSHEFSDGRFFQVIFADESATLIKFAPRTLLKVIYIREKDDIEGFEMVKIVSGQETERLKLSKFNFEQLRCFLDFINTIDLRGISQRRISLADQSLAVLDSETKKKVATLLSGENGGEVIAELLRKGIITGHDLVNTGYRKSQLQLFEKLLRADYIEQYKRDIGQPQLTDEKAWQHFFMKNEWIFGYGLDYRFQGILQREFHASDTTAAGKEAVIADYLLGDRRFTTFVEIKLPATPIFAGTKNRSHVWKLSNQLIDAYSQILEHKASGQIKIETTKELLDEFNDEIKQHAYDSRTILLFGCWSDLDGLPQGERTWKKKTFELFRRDSRNIDIVTYDELLERATFIAKNEHFQKQNKG